MWVRMRLLFFSPLALRSVGVVVLNASLNVFDRLVSDVQSLDAVSALISICFLQLFRGCPQMLERCLHVGLVLGVEVSRSQQNQRMCEYYSDMGYVSSHALPVGTMVGN